MIFLCGAGLTLRRFMTVKRRENMGHAQALLLTPTPSISKFIILSESVRNMREHFFFVFTFYHQKARACFIFFLHIGVNAWTRKTHRDASVL